MPTQQYLAEIVKQKAKACRGAIKVRKACAIKVGIMGGGTLICLCGGVFLAHRVLASAEDRALRGRNLSAVLSLINGRSGGPKAARLAPAGISFNALNPPSCYLPSHEKHQHPQQLARRVSAPFIGHLFAQARCGLISPAAVALELGISLSRFYQLRTSYLLACAHGQADTWTPGISGGDHHPQWSQEAIALATKLLSVKPPCSYSAVASELHRRLDFQTNRAAGHMEGSGDGLEGSGDGLGTGHFNFKRLRDRPGV